MGKGGAVGFSRKGSCPEAATLVLLKNNGRLLLWCEKLSPMLVACCKVKRASHAAAEVSRGHAREKKTKQKICAFAWVYEEMKMHI